MKDDQFETYEIINGMCNYVGLAFLFLMKTVIYCQIWKNKSINP